ncbi:MAG: hypothetical protein Q4E09_06225 [Eubacteriales bacterium]|nr:hypothetical protein [Eubacteriales bacterium]
MKEKNLKSYEIKQKEFDKFNPPKDVVCCPRGRASVRDKLDDYAVAAVELYGLISMQDFVDLYNDYCDDDKELTDIDEMHILLLPRVLKNEKYFFYDGYLCHSILRLNKTLIQDLISAQANKERYLPPKEEFLSYKDAIYSLSDKWEYVLDFFEDYFDKDSNAHRKNKNFIENFFSEFVEAMVFSKVYFDFSLFTEIFDEYGIIFNSQEEIQIFFKLVMDAYNDSRIWYNKGFSPRALSDRFK